MFQIGIVARKSYDDEGKLSFLIRGNNLRNIVLKAGGIPVLLLPQQVGSYEDLQIPPFLVTDEEKCRTKELLEDFAKALLNFDNVIVTDIYAAREVNTYGVSSKDLADKICSLGKDAKYIPDFEGCVKYLKESVNEGDIVMTLGAGTVTEIGPMLTQ